MAMDLNRILEGGYVDVENPLMPSVSGEMENGFLESVVKPIYETIKREVESGRDGSAPHCEWRNYDDVNEYFWSRRCFQKLKWPFDLGSTFFVRSSTRLVFESLLSL